MNLKQVKMKKLSNRQMKRLVQEVLLELSEEDRALITALYFDNVSVHKLAKELGISRPAVRYRRKRALDKMRAIIERKKSE